MIRAVLGLLIIALCAGCADNDSQASAAPECRAPGAGPAGDANCANQDGDQNGVHFSGVAQFGVGGPVR